MTSASGRNRSISFKVLAASTISDICGERRITLTVAPKALARAAVVAPIGPKPTMSHVVLAISRKGVHFAWEVGLRLPARLGLSVERSFREAQGALRFGLRGRRRSQNARGIEQTVIRVRPWGLRKARVPHGTQTNLHVEGHVEP